MSRLEGRTIVVTGGASGIGAGIAEGMAAEGASLVIADLDGERANAVAERIDAAGGQAIGVRVDVTDREQVAEAIATTVATFGKLDVYFNNAGLNAPQNFLDVTRDKWDLIMNVNAWGVVVGMQEAAKQFIAQGTAGKIVNTSSIAGRTGYGPYMPYSASKAAVISMTQSGARALAEHHITVNGFAPGIVDTPLWVQLEKDLKSMGEASVDFKTMSKDILIGRAATPNDIVPIAVFLAAPDSDYITGQIIPIEGGMILV